MPHETPLVRHFMTLNPVVIDGSLSLSDAFTRMFQIHARHLPVYVRGHLVGILSDRDIGLLSAVKGVDPEKFTVEQACSANPYTCTPDTPLEQAVQVLIEKKFGAALVMENGELVGMFTVIDAMQALIALLHREAAEDAQPRVRWHASTVSI